MPHIDVLNAMKCDRCAEEQAENTAPFCYFL